MVKYIIKKVFQTQLKLRHLTFLVLLGLVFSNTLFAESVVVSGVTLPVQSVVSVDSKSVKLTLFDNTRIVSKENLNQVVLDEYLSALKAGKALPQIAWKDLITQALSEKQVELASLGSLILIESNSDSQSLIKFFSESFAKYSSLRGEFSKAVVSEAGFDNFSAKIKAVFFFYSGSSDLSWFRTNALSRAYLCLAEIRQYGESELIELFRASDFQYVRKALAFLRFLFGNLENNYDKISLMLEMSETLKAKGTEFSLTDLLPLISFRNNENFSRHALDALLLENLHVLAKNETKAGNYNDALLVLSYISPNERTPTTHEIALQSIIGLESSATALANKQIKNMLEVIAANDPKFAAVYVHLLEQKLYYLLDQYKVLESRYVFKDILSVRPDPNLANDEIRVEQTVSVLDLDDRSLAREILKEIKTNISLLSRARLFVAGLYGSVYLYVLLFLVPLTVKYSLDILGRRKVVPSSTNKDSSIEGEPARQMFVTGGSRKQLDPVYEEYLECLKVFNLTPDADLKAIKMAYRSAVREIHPDLNSSANPDSDDAGRFVEFTKAYDRLRELHKHFQSHS